MTQQREPDLFLLFFYIFLFISQHRHQWTLLQALYFIPKMFFFHFTAVCEVFKPRVCSSFVSDLESNNVCMFVPSGAEDDEWDDEWDDVKSTGYTESESGESGAIQRGGAHGSSMKISLNK